MGKLKDTVFNEIRADYVANENSSFLYRFLLEGKLKEKCSGVSVQKRDQIVRKAAIDLMYNLGYPIAAEKRVAKARASVEDFETEFAREEEKLLDYYLKNPDKKPNIKEIKLEAEAKRQKTLSEAEDKKKNSKGRNSQNRNTALELIDAWCTQRGFSTRNEDEIPVEDCEKLFEILSGIEEGEYAVIPLRVNKMVGGGVYIVGNGWLESEDPRGYCQLIIYLPKTVMKKSNGEYIFTICPEDSGFYDVRTVFDFYDNGINDAIDNFREWNETAPKGVPDTFMRYFINDIDEETIEQGFSAELTEEELELSKKELDG